jgi:hypothetical protein
MVKTTITYVDFPPLFKEALKRDLRLSEGELTEALLEAVEHSINCGFIEMEPFYDNYSEYMCSVCGRLHWSISCQRLAQELARERENE